MHNRIVKTDSHLRHVKKFHDVEAERYQRARYHFSSCEGLAYTTRRQLVLGWLDDVVGKALDVGCGPGILTQDLLNKNLQVINADLSVEMIREAKRTTMSNPHVQNASFVASDVSQLCIADSQVDLVVCVGVVCYVKNYNSLLSELRRVLKTGGLAIIQINRIRWPNIYRKFVPLYHYIKSRITNKKYDDIDFRFNYFSYLNFLQDLEGKGFKILKLEHFDYRIPFVDILFPILSLKMGMTFFEKRNRGYSKCLAHGLLIKCEKISR